MGEFEFPTNVKQIGSIGDGMRIYMEDYAYSYLQQYTDMGGYEEKLAFIVGRQMKIDGQTVLFISGAMQGLYTSVERDIMIFTEKSWQYGREQLAKYFKGMEIVGWVHSQPGYGIYLSTKTAMYHMKTFIDKGQVLFVMDPDEKINVFYVFNEETAEMNETKGYFIYYDKNRSMHEYMLDNKVVKTKFDMKIKEETPKVIVEEVEKEVEQKVGKIHHGKAKINMKQSTKPAYKSQRRVVNLLASLSAVLFAACFIMGASLIQNDERMTVMEDQMTSLNTAYRDLMVQIKDGKTASVFAEQKETADKADNAGNKSKAIVITENGNDNLENELIIAKSEKQTSSDTPIPRAASETTVGNENQTASENEAQTTEAMSQENGSQIIIKIPETYTVQKGDSLSYISYKFYGTNDMIAKIMEVNGMDDPNKIYFGKVLKLPKS